MSLANKISDSERIFITNGIELNIRSDGRAVDDYRAIMIEQNVIETCSGSAHVTSSNTDVIVGVKLELEHFNASLTQSEWPGKGRVQLFADISAIASPAFEGKKGEDITCQLEELFSAFLPDYLDLHKLVIVPSKSYFVVYIDVVILECSSFASLIDISSIAIKTALFDVKIPKIEVLSVEHNEFSVSDDECECIALDASRVPLVTAYTKIGSRFVVDATLEEENASVATIAIAFHPPDLFALMKKVRLGSINLESIPKLQEFSVEFGQKLWDKFNRMMLKKDLCNRGKITFTFN